MAGRELAGRLGPLGVWSMGLRSADRSPMLHTPSGPSRPASSRPAMSIVS